MAITEIDRGWRRIKGALQALPRGYTKVGVQTGEQHTQPGGEQRSQAEIAAWQEFGTPDIPARPFLRAALEANLRRLREIKTRLLQRLYDGHLTPATALAALGEAHEAQVKAKLTAGPWTPNAPSTVARKGSSRPLIDTGQLRASIRHLEVLE